MYTGWSLKKFAFVNFLTVLLFISFFIEETQNLWLALDYFMFSFFNGLLAYNSFAYIVAFCGQKIFTVMLGLFMVFNCAYYLFAQFNQQEIANRFSHFFAFLTIALICYGISNLFENVNRQSPSLVVESFLNLKTFSFSFDPKVTSSSSFPSDHGVVAGLFVCFFLIYMRKSWVFCGILFLFATMPRIIAGAHWFTDVFLGSLAITIFGYTLLKTLNLHVLYKKFLVVPVTEKVFVVCQKKS